MKNTFGKGLESLIPKKRGDVIEKPFPAKKEAIFNIEIEKIKPNPYQPRKEFDQEGLNSLAESIREHGILQPLIVTRGEGNEGAPVGYQLIAGERRLLAAKMAGLIQVPVVIREPTEREKLEISLIENVQRLDLNPMEKAEAFKRLQEEFNFLQKDVAKLCGKSREAVANTLRLLELPNEIKDALKEGKITEGHAKAILMAKEPQRQKILFSKILKDGLNVRETESFVQKLEVWQPKKRTLEFIELFKDLEKKAKEILRIKTLKFGLQAGKPKLTIFFNSKKEIENFLKRFIS